MEGDLENMWNEATQDIAKIDPATENWKIQTLPLARVKKIMKSEEIILQELEKEKMQRQDGGSASEGQEKSNVKFMISGEAPVLMSKACELLIKDLSFRAWRHTERNRRRTLQRQDLHAAVGESEVYDFLIDIVPRVTTALPQTTGKPAAMHPGAVEAPVIGTTSLTAGLQTMAAPIPHAPGMVAQPAPAATAAPDPVQILNFPPTQEVVQHDPTQQQNHYMYHHQMHAAQEGAAPAPNATTAPPPVMVPQQAQQPMPGIVPPQPQQWDPNAMAAVNPAQTQPPPPAPSC